MKQYYYYPLAERLRGPRFEPRPGSSAPEQGALSSLPSLSEETLSRRSRV